MRTGSGKGGWETGSYFRRSVEMMEADISDEEVEQTMGEATFG